MKVSLKKLITSALAGILATSLVGCGKAQITRIDIPQSINIEVGQVYTIETIFLTDKADVSSKKFEAAVEELNPTWESKDTKIATVKDNGTVTAVSEGETKVVLLTNDSELFATTHVTVTSPKEDKEKKMEIESAGEVLDKDSEESKANDENSDSSKETEEEGNSDSKKQSSKSSNSRKESSNTSNNDLSNNSGNNSGNNQPTCPTCGSTSHTEHPTYTPKCQICGSTEHRTHPTCSICGSYEHTEHPTYIPKCQVCGSTEHKTHPTCPTCGSYEHTEHPKEDLPSSNNPTPTTPQPDSDNNGNGQTPVYPVITPMPPSSDGNTKPTEQRCPTCGSTKHKICYVCPSCGIVHTS